MSAILDQITAAARKEHRFDPRTEPRESIYQPAQPDLMFPGRPRFDDVTQERQYLKERLAGACRAFARQGFDYGFAGHLTIRDPERPELYWTNPMCVHFRQVKVSNLILVDHKGKVIEGDHAVNRAGFVLHAAVHEAHPDILAMCHAHTTYGTAFAAEWHQVFFRDPEGTIVEVHQQIA